MQWYSGPTLIEQVKQIYKLNPTHCCEKPLFVNIDKFFEEKKAWRGKIIQGELKKDSLVKITPVYYKGKGYTDISSKIRNIRLEKGEDVEIAESGDIIGIDLYEIQFNNKRIQKGDFETIITSCIVDQNVSLSKGNIIQFEIPISETANFNDFHLLESITIIWFGKLLTSDVIHKQQINNNWFITLEINRYLISMPVNEEKDFLFKKFLLRKKTNYFPAILKNLGFPHSLILCMDDIDNKNEIFDYVKEFTYTLENNTIIFRCDNNFKDLIKKLRKFYKFNDISHKITINLKKIIEW